MSQPEAVAAAHDVRAHLTFIVPQAVYQVAWGPAQRWYWAPEMTRNEITLIKGWDSLDDGRARFAPHGAFELPTQDPQAPPRESIEARTYLIFEG